MVSRRTWKIMLVIAGILAAYRTAKIFYAEGHILYSASLLDVLYLTMNLIMFLIIYHILYGRDKDGK